MNKKSFFNAIAVLLIIAIVAPATFFIAPQRASASAMSCIGGLVGGLAGGLAEKATSVPVSNLTISSATSGTEVSTVASCVYDMIIIPLARAIIRQILQKLTADVINWINNTPGKNGSSAAAFIRDLPQNLQTAGDAVALTFINSAATAFLSPFGAAISSSLRANYTQQTSLAGFWGANKNTLPGSLQSQQAFLSGRYSQGGVAAWFGLTTQPQNNPYMLYPASLIKLSGLVGAGVGGATGARLAQAAWGSGFMQWCGTSDSAPPVNACVTSSKGVCPSGCVPDDSTASGCAPSGTGSSLAGVKVGDPCINSDGTSGKAATPGSIIHEYTTAFVVNSNLQQLISANDLDAALGQITNALAAKVLGGVVNGVAGLFGASQPSSNGGPSITSQLQNYTPSGTSVTAATSLAESKLTQVVTYKVAWSVIGSTAGATSIVVTDLAKSCTAQASAVQTALTTEIAPVLAQAQVAYNLASATQTFALKVEAEASSGAATLTDDIQTLTTMPPSASDITDAQSNVSAAGGATASPVGSLTVSGGSLVDQMNLISANAAALKIACTPVVVDTGGG